jgi:galactonate dehydratase
MRRRDLLNFLAAGPFAAAAACSTPPAPDRHAAGVKVRSVEFIRVRVNSRGNWVFVKVHTNEGLTGIGEASHAARGDPQIAKLTEYGEWLAGKSIYEIEPFRQMAYAQVPEHGRTATVAYSGIEQALYDLQGQVAGVPVYQLFGGKLRDEIRNYANINRSTDERTPQGFAALARSAVDAGFDALKMAPYDGMPRAGSVSEIAAHTELGTNCVRAVREVIGPDRDLLVDAHSNFDLERGRALLKQLEPLKLFWLEEISRPLEVLAQLHREATMPFAGGESIFGLQNNLEYVNAEVVSTLMPDVKYVAGMLELKKVSAIAEAAGLKVAPHGPAGPIGNMAAAHVCAGLPNFSILEFSHGETDWRAELVDPPESMRNGRLRPPDSPGLGLKLNEKVAHRHAAD